MDLSQEIRSFTPIDIEKFSQDNKVSEKIIDSVKAYNKAIEYLKTGSEDIAIIELKRVVAINPDFYEAVNLLGLCYAYTKQLDKAEALFGKVVQSENNVLKAADYLNYITDGDSGASRKAARQGKIISKKQKTAEPQKEPSRKEAFKDEEVQAEYLLFKKLGNIFKKPQITLAFNIFSVICLVAAIIFFVITIKEPREVKTEDEPIANASVNDNLDKVLAQNKELQEQLDAANLKLKQYQLSSDLSQISSLYNQKKYEEAADKLKAIPVKELNSDQKKKYDALKGDAYQKAASALATQGNTLFSSGKYSEAIEKLEKVFKLGDKWSFGDKALYVLGKSYVEEGDNQKAAEAYQKLIEQYPKSSYVKYAKSRLSSIQ
ncbi:MAG: hypothetical protein K0R50_2472 [Eubacterium sp.]|nr:hypothetical protein [Eubacterium sp.]